MASSSSSACTRRLRASTWRRRSSMRRSLLRARRAGKCVQCCSGCSDDVGAEGRILVVEIVQQDRERLSKRSCFRGERGRVMRGRRREMIEPPHRSSDWAVLLVLTEPRRSEERRHIAKEVTQRGVLHLLDEGIERY